MPSTYSKDGFLLDIFRTEKAVIITFKTKPSKDLTLLLVSLKKAILANYKNIEIIIGIDNISVLTNNKDEKSIIDFIFKQDFSKSKEVDKIHTIGIRYIGKDLEKVCTTLNISLIDFINIHCSQNYYVSTIGFLPGFAYIGNLPHEIKIARKQSVVPVRKGDVAIANGFTGLYPIDSPGGWHVIGETDFINFHPEREPMFKLEIGDKIIFTPIE